MPYPEKQYHKQETAKEYTRVYELDSTDNLIVKQEDGLLGYIPALIFAKSPTIITKSNNPIVIDSTSLIVVTDMAVTPLAGRYIVNFNSQHTVDDTLSQTLLAKNNLISLYNALSALTPTNTTHTPTYGGETLSPGVYTQIGATTLSGTLTLDGGGNPNALFVFRCTGAFSTAIGSEIILTNGTSLNNVWFVAEGASSTGANSIFRGSLISNQAAVSTGVGTIITGSMFAIFGNAGVGASSTFVAPTGSSVLELGILPTFNVFTAEGNVSTTGESNIQLSIGTNSGTITGFDDSVVGGKLIPGGENRLSMFNCGVYIDGVLIPDSLRSTYRPFEAEGLQYPIVLQTLATITEGQTIDIRAYSQIGVQTIGPIMSLVITPIS